MNAHKRKSGKESIGVVDVKHPLEPGGRVWAGDPQERTITELAHELDEKDIATLAFELWQARGCPEGSPEEDWFHAVEVLNTRG